MFQTEWERLPTGKPDRRSKVQGIMDKAEERRQKRIKWINHFRIGVFAAVVILSIVVGMSVKSVLELSYEQHQLKKENAELKEKKAALKREFERINDMSYIEEQARKQLNMVKPGEIVYITDDEEDK